VGLFRRGVKKRKKGASQGGYRQWKREKEGGEIRATESMEGRIPNKDQMVEGGGRSSGASKGGNENLTSQHYEVFVELAQKKK